MNTTAEPDNEMKQIAMKSGILIGAVASFGALVAFSFLMYRQKVKTRRRNRRLVGPVPKRSMRRRRLDHGKDTRRMLMTYWRVDVNDILADVWNETVAKAIKRREAELEEAAANGRPDDQDDGVRVKRQRVFVECEAMDEQFKAWLRKRSELEPPSSDGKNERPTAPPGECGAVVVRPLAGATMPVLEIPTVSGATPKQDYCVQCYGRVALERALSPDDTDHADRAAPPRPGSPPHRSATNTDV